jgi:cell wall-associated NlpC family hydrolase
VQYEHRGTTRNGCDCTGLIIGALRELGYLKNYKLRSYPPDWNLHSKADNYIVEELSQFANEITKPSAGDLVLFYFGRCIAHVGVIIENDLFIHCYRTGRKVKVSSLWKSQWTKRIASFYRLNEDKLNG